MTAEQVRRNGWDYDLHPGDCHPSVVDGVWTTCCRECAGTGVWPVPWISSVTEGVGRDDAFCVSCKSTGRTGAGDLGGDAVVTAVGCRWCDTTTRAVILATVEVLTGCVHEHLEWIALCVFHRDEMVRLCDLPSGWGEVVCEECDKAPKPYSHTCRIVVITERALVRETV